MMQRLAVLETCGGAFYSMANTKMLTRQSFTADGNSQGSWPALTPSHTSAVIYAIAGDNPPRVPISDTHRALAARRARSRAYSFRPKRGVGNAGCPMHPQPRVQ